MPAFLIRFMVNDVGELLLPIILIGLALIVLIRLLQGWRQRQALVQPLGEVLTSEAASADTEEATEATQPAVATEEPMTIEESQIVSLSEAEETQPEISTELKETSEQQLNPFAADDLVRSMYSTMEETQETGLSNSLRAAIENYLLKTYSWQMTPEAIDKDFREILLRSEVNAPEASEPDASKNEMALSQIDRAYFVERLSSRGVFTQDAVQAIADRLEAIRWEVVSAAREAEEHHIALALRQQIETYLISTPKEQLFFDDILPDFKSILADETVDYPTLSQRLAPYDRETLRQILIQRLTHLRNITYEELELILDALGTTRDRVLSESQSLAESSSPLAVQSVSEHSQEPEFEELETEPEFEELETEPEFEELVTESRQAESVQAEPVQAPAANAPALYWTSWDQVKINPVKAASHQDQNASALTWMTWDELSRQETAPAQPSAPHQPDTPAQPDDESQP